MIEISGTVNGYYNMNTSIGVCRIPMVVFNIDYPDIVADGESVRVTILNANHLEGSAIALYNGYSSAGNVGKYAVSQFYTKNSYLWQSSNYTSFGNFIYNIIYEGVRRYQIGGEWTNPSNNFFGMSFYYAFKFNDVIYVTSAIRIFNFNVQSIIDRYEIAVQGAESEKFGYYTFNDKESDSYTNTFSFYAKNNQYVFDSTSDGTEHPQIPDGDPDPYQPGGETEPDVESPGGEWQLPEYIPPDTPSPINDLNLGLFRAYAMTDSQLTQFSRQLWSKDILQQLRNLVVSPLDVVIQLLSLPFEPEASSSATNITFNWLDGWMPGESAATGYRLTTEYKEISFVGRSDINRYSGLFYDYLPYTRCHLFIPYIGFIEVKANEFIKAHSLTLKYNVNQLTGEFTVFVKTSAMPYQLGQYQGQMGRPLPLSMANYIPLVSSTIQAAAYGTAAIVGGGAMIGSLASNMASRFNPLGLSENKNIVNPKNPLSNSASALNAVLNANIPIQRNGSFGPVTGRTSTQVPFLVFSIPHQNISSQQKILGYSSNLSGPLVNYNGVTKVRDIQLAIPSATLTEINELQSILEGGIEI